jgi:hypothetical protein
MKTWGSGVAPPFLTLALDCGQLHAPATLLEERAPSTYWIGGWVAPRASLDAVKKRIILPLLGIEPVLSSP